MRDLARNLLQVVLAGVIDGNCRGRRSAGGLGRLGLGRRGRQQARAQRLAGLGRRLGELGRRALRHQLPALRPTARSQVNHPVRRRDDVQIMLDDDDAGPLIDQGVQRRHHRPHVLGVQAGAGLIDDKQRPRGRLAERPRQLEALRLTA